MWFDAPMGYISITANYTDEWRQWWQNPEQVKMYQFMGKDNTPFHSVVFPSSLLASKKDWTFVHHISTTEYLQYEDKKFSKSKNTGVFGDDVVGTGIPISVWRYYLLTNRPEQSDSYFNWDDLMAKNNNELIANPGNLCNRVLKFLFKNRGGVIPSIAKDLLNQADKDFLGSLMASFKNYCDLLEFVKIKEGLKVVMEFSSLLNK